MSLLVLENISKEYGNQKVLDNVSLRVERGERVALVGANGAGKSTLIKIAMGLEYGDSGNIIKARGAKIAYLSQDMMELNEIGEETALYCEEIIRLEERIKELENQLQNFNGDYECKDYEKILNKYSNALNEYESMDGYTIENKIMKILLGLGLKKEVLAVPISKLSGGEKMRVILARMLINDPDLIILDEPTNHLDINAIEWLEKFLKKFPGGVLMVSHDRYFLDEASTRIAELQGGHICERSCTYTQFVEEKNRMREYYKWEKKGLDMQIKREKEIIIELRYQRKISAFKSREKRLNMLIEKKKSEQDSFKSSNHLKKDNKPKIKFTNVNNVSKDIAWAENLNKSFGDVNIINDGLFHIGGGERVGIVGHNGCGKTTLLNILLGKDKEFKGTATLGNWVKYSYLGQDIYFENEHMTMLQEIMSIKEMTEKEARNHLSKFQFYGDEVNKELRVLSGGERVRVYLAEILLNEPHCLIMDEPTNHLDLDGREAIEKALKEYKGTVIAVSHDRYFLNNSIDKIIEIENGNIYTYYGNYDLYKSEKRKSQEGENKSNTRENFSVEKNKANEKNSDKVALGKSKERDRANAEEIEGKIIKLEEIMKSMEECFNENTSYEEYEEYGNLSNEVTMLYEMLG